MAAASALNIPNTNGVLVYVRSLKAYFYLDNNSTLATDGITIIPSIFGGNTRLIRLPEAHPFWSRQATWFINQSTGNDENSGIASDAPLRTPKEWVRRMGTNVVRQNMTVTYQAPSTQPLSGTVTRGPDVIIAFVGGVGTAPIAAAVVGAGMTAQNRATNTRYNVVSAGVVGSWAPYVGMRYRNTANGTTAWILLGDENGGTMSRPAIVAPDPFAVPFGALTLGTIAAGNTFNIETLIACSVGDLTVQCEGGLNLDATGVSFTELDIFADNNNGMFGGVTGSAAVYFGCRFSSPMWGAVGVNANTYLNCLFLDGIGVEAGDHDFEAGAAFSFFAPPSPGLWIRGPARVTVDGDFMTEGSSICANAGTLLIGSAAAFNTPAEADNGLGAGLCIGGSTAPSSLGGRPGAGAHVASISYGINFIWGQGNLIGIHVGAMSGLAYTTAANLLIAGSAANNAFRLGNAAAGVQTTDPAGAAIGPINQSWANFVAARPGGFGGTATNPTNLATITPGA